MHDEVSETENIRKNLAIERMIIGGCDILLDVNQVRIVSNVTRLLSSTLIRSAHLKPEFGFSLKPEK